MISWTGYKEYNDSATDQTFNQHMEDVKDWQPVKHGHWVKYDRYAVDSDGKPVLKTGEEYECSICGRVESNPELYCHCGAKMDEEVEDE